jgi:hypothetical protein
MQLAQHSFIVSQGLLQSKDMVYIKSHSADTDTSIPRNLTLDVTKVDADRELGRGISASVGGSATATAGIMVDDDADCRCALELRRGRDSGFDPETGTGRNLVAEPEPARTRALLVGLEDGLGAEGRSCGTESAESSHTFGGPECGPRRLRIDKKCSQS